MPRVSFSGIVEVILRFPTWGVNAQWTAFCLIIGAAASIFGGWVAYFALALYSAPLVFYICIKIHNSVSDRRIAAMIKGLYYEKVSFEFTYYANFNFHSKNTFKIVNKTGGAVDKIPSTKFSYSGEGEIRSIRYRVIGVNRAISKINNSFSKIYNAATKIFSSAGRYVEWDVSLAPPLAPDESLLYQVALQTSGTEKDAFSSGGAILGFPAHLHCKSVVILAVAPKDYSFEIVGSVIIVDIESLKIVNYDISHIKMPTISISGQILNWEMKDVEPGFRYWIRFKFVKGVYDGEAVQG